MEPVEMPSRPSPLYTPWVPSDYIPKVHKDAVNVSTNQEASKLEQQAGPFDDEGTRNGYIQKVLALVLLQVLAVGGIMIGVLNCYYIRYNIIHLYRVPVISVTGVALFGTLALLAFCDEARKRAPYKHMFFILYPLTFGAFVGVSSIHYAIDHLTFGWVSLCLALVVMLVHSIFSFQTKFEFSLKNGMLINVVTLLIIFGITITWLLPRNMSWFTVFPLTLAVILLSAYIMCDVLVMTGGKYRFEVTASDYVLGVLYLHTDYAYIIKLLFSSNLKSAM